MKLLLGKVDHLRTIIQLLAAWGWLAWCATLVGVVSLLATTHAVMAHQGTEPITASHICFGKDPLQYFLPSSGQISRSDSRWSYEPRVPS